MMQAETPAEGIYKRNNWGDSVVYSVPCQCGNDDCTHNVWVEADDITVSVTTYTRQTSKFWSMSRWQTIWTLLIKGYVEYEASIVMSKQQAVNYANALQLAVDQVEKFKNAKSK
jgi:hypothetical protein